MSWSIKSLRKSRGVTRSARTRLFPELWPAPSGQVPCQGDRHQSLTSDRSGSLTRARSKKHFDSDRNPGRAKGFLTRQHRSRHCTGRWTTQRRRHYLGNGRWSDQLAAIGAGNIDHVFMCLARVINPALDYLNTLQGGRSRGSRIAHTRNFGDRG